MRALVIAVVMLLGSALALAKPKVAVAPIKGDANDQLAGVLTEILQDSAKVTGPADVASTGKKARSGQLTETDIKRLKNKLGVSVIVHGTLKKAGEKKTLSLIVSGKNDKPSKFSVKFKSAASDKFRDSVRGELVKRVAEEAEDEPVAEETGKSRRERDREKAEKDREASDDGEARRKKDKDEPDERERRKKDKDEPDEREARRKKDKDEADERDAQRKKDKDEADEREARRKRDKDKEVAEADGEVRKKGKRKPRGDDGEGEPEEGVTASARTPMTQPAARVDAGLTFGLRQLSWSATGNMRPPNVSLPAPSARVEGELYPLALADPKSPLRGLGLAAEYDKSFANSIAVPKTTTKATIDQAHYAIGARYRIEVGAASSVALGIDYERRHTIADRTGLMPNALDTPDVDYIAIAPNLGARVPVTPRVTVFGDAAFMVITQTGPIQKADSYGYATVYGLEADAGLDIGLTKQLALRIAGELAQVSFTFKKGQGTLAMTRNVDSATDRSLCLAATLAVVY